jgi:heterodisulfide reductase subunit C
MTRASSDATSREFLEHICAIPNGEKIRRCLQCGTCSASCPTSYAMDHSPREIIAALRAGLIDRVLNSNTAWFCTSCYSCTVRCPAGIPFTDVMYELKRLSAERDRRGGHDPTAVMAKAFVRTIDRHGRNHEPELVRWFYLHTRPLRALGQIGLAFRLWRRGRMAARAHDIRDLAALRKMLAAVAEREAP